MNPTVEKILTRNKRGQTPKNLIAELYGTKDKSEIINGKIVKFMATGDAPGTAAANVLVSLKLY